MADQLELYSIDEEEEPEYEEIGTEALRLLDLSSTAESTPLRVLDNCLSPFISEADIILH